MSIFGSRKAIGLDLGQAAVKAVSVGLQGKNVVFLGSHTFNARAEGILDDAELRSSVAEWLGQIGWAGEELSVGLPQYLTTTQVSDFPPGVTSGLEEMVAYETRQLGGLSEEKFIHDYQVMAPNFGRKNPVLIGICRESVVLEKAEALRSTGINMMELGMNGTAVASALFHLCPDTLTTAEPELVLDIGAESSTLLVTAGGQVLFVASLLFGAEKYTQALAKHLGVSEQEAEKAKLNARLNPTDTDSPLYAATRQLESEVRTAVEHWRSQETPEIGNKMFARFWFSGGGAKLAGLAEHFSRSYGCPAQLFGPLVTETGERHPELVTAYGLALQGLGQARMAISLCPPPVTWLRLRLRRFGYLVATAALALLFVAGLMFRYYRNLVAEEAHIRAEIEELRLCQGLIPQLEDALGAVRHHELMLLPFVDKGNRARRYLVTLQELAQARGEGDWFIYVADEKTYAKRAEEKKEEPEEPKEPERKPVRRPEAGGLLLLGANNGDIAETGSDSSAYPGAVNVASMAPLEAMVVAGCTPLAAGGKTYERVREIVRKLDPTQKKEVKSQEIPEDPVKPARAGFFKNVDVLPEREDIFEPWLNFFERLNQPLRDRDRKRYQAFTLRLPFATFDINPPAPAANKEKPGP